MEIKMIDAKSSHGGLRPGAGRKRKRPSAALERVESLPSAALAALESDCSAAVETLARRHAPLAIEVLRQIAETGVMESARVMAAKVLLDRGFGTVSPARAADNAPLGKKAEASRAAKVAATGRYATPPVPRRLGETMQ